MMANRRLVTIKSAAAVKWQLQTGSHMFGLILAASTRQAVPNFQKPLTPCTSGIDFLRSVMSTWQMFLAVWDGGPLWKLSGRAGGLLEGGRYKN